MSFHDIKLPEFIGIFAHGILEYNTYSAKSLSGREIRSSANEQHLMKYLIKDCYLSEYEFSIFNSFFKARMGKLCSFRFKDLADYKAQNQMMGTGDGVRQKFLLIKKYDDPFMSFDRVIRRPVSSTVKLYINNQEISEGYNIQNGVIHFSKPLATGANLIANFEFDVEVRFNNDKFAYTYRSDGSTEISNIELIEVV